ncbi:MAG: DUF4382 domain-containing protein [Bacillota bacterium]|nr:DUF4382 domain-containing protein [Bacillota bacterium]
MKKYASIFFMALITLSLILTGCNTAVKDEVTKDNSGSLLFTANGEDFVREGFITKDGWSLSFDHVYITLSDITAYQTNPPYEPENGPEIQAIETVILEKLYTVDLATGEEDAEPILVGEVKNVPVGHYNAISWNMLKENNGEFKGYSLVLLGEAVKDSHTVDFTIKLAPEFSYRGGEFIGDERKGIVTAGDIGDLEMTFHFDHIFGDGALPADDELNLGAFGFEPFASLSQDGKLDISMTELEEQLTAEQYQALLKIFPDFGHVGEGHTYSEQL